MGDTSKGIQNFFKVASAAMIQPTRLVTLGVGIGVSLLFPPVTLPMMGLTFATVFAMSWADINDENFMKRVLQNAQITSSGATVASELVVITQLSKSNELYPEVREDLIKAKDTLQRILALLGKIPPEEVSALAFAQDYVAKICRRLVRLSTLEQRAREFLQHEDGDKLSDRIKRVSEQIKTTEDTIAKKEYQKTLSLLKDQEDLGKNLAMKLQRIESYILRINTTLENTYAQLNKLALRDETTIVDEGEILNDSLKQMVTDLDEFEKQNVEIVDALGTDGTESIKKEKTKDGISISS